MLATADGTTLAVPVPVPAPLPRVAQLSRCVLLFAIAVGLLAPGLMRSLGPALLLGSGLLGLPHGAVDHLAWGWSRGQIRPRPRVVILYASAAVTAVAGALLAPLPALLLLLALAAAHFAEGEFAWARLVGRAGTAAPAATGLAAVALPLLLRPAQVAQLLGRLHPDLPHVLLQPSVRWPVLTLTAAAIVLGVVHSRHDRPALGELALVVVAAAVLPPLAAFATWFAGWHALRHTARLVVLDPRNVADLAADRLGPALARFARSAAWPTAAALVGTLALAVVAGPTGATLVALLALTVPHSAVVARLGRGPANLRSGPTLR